MLPLLLRLSHRAAVSLITRLLSHCAYLLLRLFPCCACYLSGHAASLIAAPLPSCLFPHCVSLVALVTSLVMLLISSFRLSHCVASPIAPAACCCILASLIVPLPLLSRLLSYHVSFDTPPPLSSYLSSFLMLLLMPVTSPTPTLPMMWVNPCALVCMSTLPLHCVRAIHQGTSCLSHFVMYALPLRK